jgi:hypothetical protein
MGMYDSYGTGALDKLKENYNSEYILRDIEYGQKNIDQIQTFIRAARGQLAVIANTVFVSEVTIERRIYKKIEYYVSSAQVPQVPGGQRMKVYPHDDSKRFTGQERKAAIVYAQQLSQKHGNCRIVGNYAEHVPAIKEMIVL